MDEFYLEEFLRVEFDNPSDLPLVEVLVLNSRAVYQIISEKYPEEHIQLYQCLDELADDIVTYRVLVWNRAYLN